MTLNPRPTKQKRANKNRHYRSTLNLKVRELIDILRKGWAVMRRLERGRRINRLVSAGCSKRGLAKEIGVSETSIRRHSEIAHLPEDDRKAIGGGKSGKKILALKATAARQGRIQQRIDEDRRTGALSDGIATKILEFCRTGYKLRKQPMIRAMFPILLDNVGSFLRKFEQTDRRPCKAARKFDSRELFRKTRPRLVKNTPDMVHQGEWLAEALWLIAPESPIRATALIKAKKRARELEPKMSPAEAFRDAVLSRKAKFIELDNLPSRKIYPGGARTMKRQGPASPPTKPERPKNIDSNP